MKTKRSNTWIFIPVIISFLLLAAHFSRANNTPMVILVLAIPLLLIIRQIWSIRLIQLVLFLGAAEWIRATIAYVKIRLETHEDPTTLIIILGSVAFFTLLSAALLFLVKNRSK